MAAPLLATEIIGSILDVTTILPTACPSIIGMPKPSWQDGKFIISAF